MPDPYERHSRSRWEWGSPGARSQERAAAAADDPARIQVPGKKPPGMCKAEHWKAPHDTVMQARPHGWSRMRTCGWRSSYDGSAPWWSCLHHEICAGCGKDFGSVSPRRCPEYHEITPAEQRVIDAELAAHAARRAAYPPRLRRVITGPQGYRKKKPD